MTTPVFRVPADRRFGSLLHPTAGALGSTAVEHELLSYCRICAAACGIVGDRRRRAGRCACAVMPTTRRRAATRARRAGVSPPGTTARRGSTAPGSGAARSAGTRPSTISRRWCATPSPASAPDAVALYLATGLAYDSAGQVAAGSFLARAREHLLLHRGDRRQRAGARRRGAGHRQRDDEPVVGPDHARAPAPGGHEPGGVARLRHHPARSGQLPPRLPARAAGACG